MSMAFSNATDENHWEKMNANELADAIQYCGDGGYNLDAAIMLRKQAKEIEVLNQSYELLFKHRIEQEKEIKDLRQIVESTIKQALYEDDYHKLKAEYDLLKEKLIASISKQSLVEDLNDMHIAKSIQRARDHFKFGEKK